MSQDLPRERLSRMGPEALSDSELIAILLATGRPGASVMSVAAEVSRTFPGSSLGLASLEELCRVPGVGMAKACRLAAAFELGRRALAPALSRPQIRSASDAFAIVGPQLGDQTEERAVTLLLDARGGLISSPTVALGALSALALHPRQVFREAIRRDAASILLVHNHPSGDLTVSRQDFETTRTLLDIGILLGIPLIDHIVVGGRRFVSLRETTQLWDGGPDPPRNQASQTVPGPIRAEPGSGT